MSNRTLINIKSPRKVILLSNHDLQMLLAMFYYLIKIAEERQKHQNIC